MTIQLRYLWNTGFYALLLAPSFFSFHVFGTISQHLLCLQSLGMGQKFLNIDLQNCSFSSYWIVWSLSPLRHNYLYVLAWCMSTKNSPHIWFYYSYFKTDFFDFQLFLLSSFIYFTTNITSQCHQINEIIWDRLCLSVFNSL